MKDSSMRRISLLLAVMMSFTSVFMSEAVFADEEEEGAVTIEEEAAPAEEEAGPKLQEAKGQAAVQENGDQSAESEEQDVKRSMDTNLVLSYEAVENKVYRNKEGKFKVTFTGAWEDPSEYEEMVADGWTFKYELRDKKNNVLKKEFDLVNGYTMKIKSDKGPFKLVATASKKGEEDITKESNLISKFVFPGQPKKLKATTKKSGNDVKLSWKKGAKADYYFLYRSRKNKKPKEPYKRVTEGTSYKDENLEGGKYYYWVQAVYKGGNYKTASEVSIKDSVSVARYLTVRIRPYKWFVKLKRTAKLYKNRTGGAYAGKAKKGSKLYITKHYPSSVSNRGVPRKMYAKLVKDGKVIKKGWVAHKDTKGIHAEVAYSKKVKRGLDWTKEKKEKWVNKKGYSSPTKYLIWVNTYTQRLNLFKGSKGRWKLVRSNRCVTGKYTAPTRRGKFRIKRKKWMRTRTDPYTKHQYYYTHLSIFRAGDAIHTVPWRLGTKHVTKGINNRLIPNTKGCCRMATANAAWIYNHVPKRTRMIVY